MGEPCRTYDGSAIETDAAVIAAHPMNAIGKPIPGEGREAGYQVCREMGLDAGDAWELTGRIARCLESDQPFVAQKVGLASPLDLTGYFRLVATMLVHVDVNTQQKETQ